MNKPQYHLLPDNPDDINLFDLARGLMWCYGPAGIWHGLYREGHGVSCINHLNRFILAVRTKTSTGEKRLETYYKIKSEIEQQLEKPDKPPVWSLRKNPPSDFHNYLQMSEEEEENYMKSLKHNFVEEE